MSELERCRARWMAERAELLVECQNAAITLHHARERLAALEATVARVTAEAEANARLATRCGAARDRWRARALALQLHRGTEPAEGIQAVVAVVHAARRVRTQATLESVRALAAALDALDCYAPPPTHVDG